MYGAEQGREKRDVSWTAQAPEWSFPSSMAMKMPQRQTWGDGKRKCLEDRSVPSPWPFLPLGLTFRWTLQEPLSTWCRTVRGSGNTVWAAKSWRHLGEGGFGS